MDAHQNKHGFQQGNGNVKNTSMHTSKRSQHGGGGFGDGQDSASDRGRGQRKVLSAMNGFGNVNGGDGGGGNGFDSNGQMRKSRDVLRCEWH
jgi:hypothetical protein